jgi:hypothetical protein
MTLQDTKQARQTHETAVGCVLSGSGNRFANVEVNVNLLNSNKIGRSFGTAQSLHSTTVQADELEEIVRFKHRLLLARSTELT